MNKLAKSLLHQDDFRAQRIGKQIEYLDGLRERGFRHTEISIDAYEQLLLENLTLQMTQREWVRQHAQMLAIHPGMPIMVRRPIDEVLSPDVVNAQIKIETCPDCDAAKKHAYSDATIPGFFFATCEKHRAR